MRTEANDYTYTQYLKQAERKLDATKRYYPDSSEEKRLDLIVKDIISKMSKDELTAYQISKTKVDTKEELAARNRREIDNMEKNRDSVSI